MIRTLLPLLALLLVASLPSVARAGEKDDDEGEGEDAPGIPPWVGDDDDKDDDDKDDDDKDDDRDDDDRDDDDKDDDRGDRDDDRGDRDDDRRDRDDDRGDRDDDRDERGGRKGGRSGARDGARDADDSRPAGGGRGGRSPDPSDLGTLKGGGAFGIGVAAGTINGLSLKVWPSRVHGIVLHLGAHPSVLNTVAASLGYRVHLPPLLVPGYPVALHFGLGPCFRVRAVFFADGTYLEGAGGLALGASVTVAEVPAELYFEAIPSFGGDLNMEGVVGLGFSVDGVVGARFFFGGR